MLNLIIVKEVSFEYQVIVARSQDYDDIWTLYDSITFADPTGNYKLMVA